MARSMTSDSPAKRTIQLATKPTRIRLHMCMLLLLLLLPACCWLLAATYSDSLLSSRRATRHASNAGCCVFKPRNAPCLKCWLLIKDAVWTEAADSCCCRCAGFLYTCCCCHCAAHSSGTHLLPGRNKFIERMLRWAWPKSSPDTQFQVRHGAVGQEH